MALKYFKATFIVVFILISIFSVLFLNLDNIKKAYIYPIISSNLPEGTSFQSAEIGINGITVYNARIGNEVTPTRKRGITFSAGCQACVFSNALTLSM